MEGVHKRKSSSMKIRASKFLSIACGKKGSLVLEEDR